MIGDDTQNTTAMNIQVMLDNWWVVKGHIYTPRQFWGIEILAEAAGIDIHTNTYTEQDVLSGRVYIGWALKRECLVFQASNYEGDVEVTYDDLVAFLKYKIEAKRERESCMRQNWIIRKLTPKQALTLDILIRAAGLPLSGYTENYGVIPHEGICRSSRLTCVTTAVVGENYRFHCEEISYDELVEELTKEIKSKIK